MGDNTEFDLNDLPEEVLDEIANGEAFTVEEEPTATPAPTTEKTLVVEAPTKPTDNEIIDELVVAAEKKAGKKKPVSQEPGMYHNGRKIESVPSKLGKKWIIIVDGKREKVLRSEIEVIE